jgi:hypothetical protein
LLAGSKPRAHAIVMLRGYSLAFRYACTAASIILVLLSTGCGGRDVRTFGARSPQVAQGSVAQPAGPIPLAPSSTLPDQPPAVRPSIPEAFPGTGQFVRPLQSTPSDQRTVVTPDGNVAFNFINADVREVVREILGEQLRLSYVVDPRIQASITAQTGSPLPRDAVLSVLENVLRASNLALVSQTVFFAYCRWRRRRARARRP